GGGGGGGGGGAGVGGGGGGGGGGEGGGGGGGGGGDHPVSFALFRQSPWWHYGVLSLEQTQLTVRSPYLDNDVVQTVYRAPTPIGVHGDVRLRLISEASPTLRRIRTDRGVGGRPGNPFAAVS